VLDHFTADYIQDHRRKCKVFHLSKLNAHLSELKMIWPEARQIDFYLAFSLVDYDLDQMREKLRDPAFIRLVVSQAEDCGFGKVPPRVPLSFVLRGQRKERTQTQQIQAMSEQFTDDWFRYGAKPGVMSYHGSPPMGGGPGDLKPISPIEPESDGQELKLTFVKDRARFSVGQLYRGQGLAPG
jgi:hypothetical protein